MVGALVVGWGVGGVIGSILPPFELEWNFENVLASASLVSSGIGIWGQCRGSTNQPVTSTMMWEKFTDQHLCTAEIVLML